MVRRPHRREVHQCVAARRWDHARIEHGREGRQRFEGTICVPLVGVWRRLSAAVLEDGDLGARAAVRIDRVGAFGLAEAARQLKLRLRAQPGLVAEEEDLVLHESRVKLRAARQQGARDIFFGGIGARALWSTRALFSACSIWAGRGGGYKAWSPHRTACR
eukprot:7378241-Prymnesium_polylepis.1